MIFKYTFVNDKAKNLQKLITHIVIDVWCNARGKIFSLNEISNKNGYRKKVKDTPKNLHEPIEKIFNICSTLSQSQIDYIKDAFIKNNQIEELCNNTVVPVFYESLTSTIDADFSKEIKSFFKNLYEQVFKQTDFHLNSHYDKFFTSNDKLCPFCGLNPLEKDSSNHRDDYDHYLPKEKYPFNAINLKNLYPMCGDCNKKWKKTNNPIHDGVSQKQAFFYYNNAVDPIVDISVNFINTDIQNLDLNITFSSATQQNEIDSWDRIFSTSRRYKDILLHEQIGKKWLRFEKAQYDRSIQQNSYYSVQSTIYLAKSDRLGDKNFIKAPFLEACQNAGIIN